MEPQSENKVDSTKPADTMAAAESDAPQVTDVTNASAPAATTSAENKDDMPATNEKKDETSEKPATEAPAASPEAEQNGDAEPIKTEGASAVDVKPEEPKAEESKTGESKAEEPKTEDKPAAEAAPAPEEPKTEAPVVTGPVWPELAADHPLSKLLADLPELLKSTQYDEVYGITLKESGDFHTKLILQKFLRANSNNIDKAKDQLRETLEWRREFRPLEAMKAGFDKNIFNGLGYIVEIEGVPESTNKKDIVTFNVYGAVEDKKATFGNLEGFIRWRVALMEKGIAKLKLNEATVPIPDFNQGPDPYQGIQVHDYLSVSFIRQDPHVKAASKRTIELFSKVYPETLSRKFFVNVPVVMGWMFTAMKVLLPKETVKKFTVLSYGNQLASQLGDGVPEAYGGKAGTLNDVAEQTLLE
ncbi:CRAL/TRIO domain-containing protein [Phyllosticta citriasiana]|uniref:Phosphatidylinositol transfer protein SFH5 n=1 Tax=Phyllosticta citriasiana TaxID=595635 RepID=A0ABR1KVB2_9PEZI